MQHEEFFLEEKKKPTTALSLRRTSFLLASCLETEFCKRRMKIKNSNQFPNNKHNAQHHTESPEIDVHYNPFFFAFDSLSVLVGVWASQFGGSGPVNERGPRTVR